MLELLFSFEAWASLLTLTALEIVLGIDNIIFISIVTGGLPRERQPFARRLGLGLALLMRLLLLFSISWIVGLTQPAFALGGWTVSWRDIVLGLGGLFLLAKATIEIHAMTEGRVESARPGSTTMVAAILQIALLDMVFSLDSVITAVGMAEHIEIMVAAVVIAMIVMLLAAEPTARFVNEHPSVKMLALGFLLLIGMALVGDALQYHIPRGYLYFAIAFSALVEGLNLIAARARERRREREMPAPPAAVADPARDPSPGSGTTASPELRDEAAGTSGSVPDAEREEGADER
ncbi:MAG TPA: TerC family protein [Rhodospirillales bacterium]|nr:TerC family protein [Rhodospirillales bacterium]